MPSSDQPAYRVVASERVQDRITQLFQKARRKGLDGQFHDMLKAATERLQTSPSDFGEPLFRLRSLGADLRIASLRPIVLHFFVNEAHRAVFLQDLAYLQEEVLE